MHQQRRSRRREEPPSGRGRDWMSPAPAEGNSRIRDQQDAFDYTCKIGFSADESSFAPKIRKGSSKKATGILMKEPTHEEEVSKRRELKYGSPNLISRLMGLVTLPSPSRKQKTKHHCSHRRTSTSEDLEFIDVFEVTKMSKRKKHRKYSDSKGMHSWRGNETDRDFDKHMFLESKGFPTSELLKKCHRSDDASEVLDSRSDIFPELLQDPQSLFANHLRDLNRGSSSPNRGSSSALKPFEGTKIWKSDVQCKSSRSEKNPKITGSDLMMHAESLDKNRAKGNSGFISNSSPAHIVILKPCLEKAQKMADATKSSSHENSRFCSRRCSEIVGSVMEELHNDGIDKQKLMQHANIWSHKAVVSTDTSREIKGKLRQNTKSQTKKNFTSEMNPYDGIMDSFSLPGIDRPDHSEAIYQSRGHFGKWSSSFSPRSLYSSESSVIREAQNRLFERWKIGCQFQDMGLVPLRSNKLGEILELSDRETPEDAVDFLNTRNVSDEKLPREEVLGNKVNPSSIGCNIGFKADRSRSLPRSKSQVAASCRLELSGKELRPSSSTDAQFSEPEAALSRSSKHPTSTPRRSHSAVEENMLPEWETHVNYEGSSRSIRLRYYLDSMSSDSAPNYAFRDRNQLTNNMPISIIDDNSCHLTAQEEQVMQSAQDISSDHPQEEPLPSESDVAEPHPQVSKETEQQSPISVLESPSDDETYSSGCFERLSVDLKELRLQLHLLKLESVDKRTDEDALVPSDADYEGESNVLLDPGEARQFRDDDRDFIYLLDMLIESGIRDVDENKLSDSVDQNVFYKLEKKYHKITAWSRSERKLLFDLINYIIAGIATPYVNLHLSAISKIRPPAWNREGLVETLWQMLVKKRKEQCCNEENKILEPAWSDSENDVDSIGTEIEIMLIDDLLEELVGELVLS